jgi:fatty-acyl-CoA synthase
MSNPLYAFPTTCEQTLQALARYPSRTAFAWPDGSITYQPRSLSWRYSNWTK